MAHPGWSCTTPLAMLVAVVGVSCGADVPAPTGGGTAAESAGSGGDVGPGSNGDDTAPGSGGESGPGPDVPDRDDPDDPCVGLDCLPCGNGIGCAEEGAFLGSTCCTEGDPLTYRAPGSGAEVVDVETDGVLTITCGGFGASVDDVAGEPRTVGGASSRCQRIAFGPVLPGGEKIFYLAHHGDTWVPNPFLGTYRYDPAIEEVAEVDVQYEAAVLYEGLAYHAGILYVAAHGGGVRVYRTDERGVPAFARAVDGFENAIKLAVADAHLYVADGNGGVGVLSLAQPESPAPVASIPTRGLSRDLDVANGRLFVAQGGEGVTVFDIADPQAPVEIEHFRAHGSVQAVDVDGDILALAAWSHVAVYDATTLVLLGTERVRPTPQFEQDLGVAVHDGVVHVGEWEGLHVLEHHPGRVAPDILVEQEIFEFSADRADSAVVVVRNRGYLDLSVSGIEAQTDGDGDVFWADADTLSVPPGEARAFEVGFEPPPTLQGTGTVSLTSNDPDHTQRPMVVPLRAAASDKLDVGDRLDERFAFLDPTGQDRVENLDGHVLVLAYFALF